MIKITFCFLMTIISFSQSWEFSEEGNPFDGKYKIASIIGCTTTTQDYFASYPPQNVIHKNLSRFYISFVN